MIWGEAGVGKTIFCGKFRQDWAIVVKKKEGKEQELTPEQKSELEKLTEEQRSKLNNIGLLFSIVLRDIDEGAKSVKDIIFSQLGFHKEGSFMSQPGLKSQLLGLLENVSEHSRLVLLMDGFDEISDKDKKIEKVITGGTYQNIHCITTCRPHVIGDNVLNVDVEIRLKGFSEAQAKVFVEMFARIEYTKQDQIVTFVKQTMSQIESSADLTEMSTNPSMLQLMCHLLGWNKGKLGKDRTSLLKDYTRYLLMQYHIKIGKKEELYSDDLYHQNLLDAGKVALMGLRQNQLQLVFSKREVQNTCGKTIFEIGFLIELPSTVTDTVKVQFTHKTLQEYLAAFYVVNTRGYKGLQLLMEFCSTSQRMMGSQIILAFISNMSTTILGKAIQKKVQDFVSKWDSDDKINPISRTSFLISMLEGNEIKFPLPAIVDINFSRYFYFKKSPLDRFLDMNGQGVKKLTVTLSLKNRLNLLQNRTINSLDELHIVNDEAKNWSREDTEGLCAVMKKMKPGLLSIKCCEWESMSKATIDVILQHLHTLILMKCGVNKEHLFSTLRREHYLKVLKVDQSGVTIDGEVIDAVSKLSYDIKLDISGGEIALKQKSPSMKSMSVSNCLIDTEIAKAVSRLPDDIQLDLSGNKLTMLDPRLLPGLLLHMPEDKEINMTECEVTIDVDIVRALSKMPQLKSLKAANNKLTPEAVKELFMSKLQKLDLSNCGFEIDTEIAEAVSRLPDEIQLDLSGNQVTDKSACITLIHKAATMKSLNIHNSMSNCGIQIDTEIAEAVSKLPDHTQLDLSGNRVTDKSTCLTLIHKAAAMKSLNICDCMSNSGIQIDMEIAEVVSRLPDHTELDLSGNQVTDKSACITLIHKAATMKSLNIRNCMSNCGIQIDTEIAKAVSRLPDDIQLDLSGNQVTDKSACIALIHKATTMKFPSLCNCMYNCGIEIDTEIAESVSRLPDETELDLSGNQVTDKSACITLIHKAATMKCLNIHNCMYNCGIQIDKDLAEAVSRLPDDIQLDLSGNELTKIEPRLLSGVLAHMPEDKKINMNSWGISIDMDIVKALSKMPQLQSLHASNNKMPPEAAKELFMSKLQKLDLSDCGIQIDTEIAEAVSRLPDHTELDLSGNQVTDKSACITLIHKAATMKSVNIHNCMSNCGIKIDTEIAEAVSRLPDDIQLDLSGNKLTKMDPRLLPGVLLHMPEDEEIHIEGWGIIIDVDIFKALSRMPQLKSLKASCNKLTPETAREFSMSKLQQLFLSDCGINDTVCVSLMISLSEQCPLLQELVLCSNNLTSDEWCHHVKMKKLMVLQLGSCGLNDTVCVKLMMSLSKHCPMLCALNLCVNKLKSDEWYHHVMKKLRWLALSSCGINDTVCVSLMISLSKHCPMLEVLKLSHNSLTSGEWCHHVQMKQLRELYLCNCGIQDTVCESLMISLSKHCPLLQILNLSNEIHIGFGNELTSDEWCHYVQMEQLRELYLTNCNISDTVCVSLMISLSKHCPLLEVLNIGNTDMAVFKLPWNNDLKSGKWCDHVQMKRLMKLYLRDCGINITVCVSLMISLSEHCPLLELLDLRCNIVTWPDVLEIVDHIKHMKQLRELWLSGNPCMEDLQCREKCIKEVKGALQKSNPGLEVKAEF